MSQLVYRCDRCGDEHLDVAGTDAQQFCWKCGGRDFTTRDPAEDTQLMAMKNAALLLVIAELARRCELDGDDVLEMLQQAEAQVLAENDAAIAANDVAARHQS